MSNVTFEYFNNGCTVKGTLPNKYSFLIDADMLPQIKDVNFYVGSKSRHGKNYYLIDSRGRSLHNYLFGHKKGLEIDHINQNTFDNRRCNIRYCTHQQNQMNQDLQCNNTSGFAGVGYYSKGKKYRARIKVGGYDIHLGYYSTIDEAIQARHIGMLCMFGEYGCYNKVTNISDSIKLIVVEKCKKYIHLAQNLAFFDFWDENVGATTGNRSS